jgi:hypothetical protein
MRRLAPAVGLGCALLMASTAVTAQQRASIVGVVHEPTGAVMPGVTVEASSPALIEQMRIAVTVG